jgi:pyruvate ferredoxin oxidoreductase gamma subunit
MFQVCIHGRGGQGVVTASELLGQAAFSEGHNVQIIPSFGSERTGAPVVSFCRIAAEAIYTREPVHSPDAVIVQDPTLLAAMDPFAGIAADGWAVVNTRRSADDVRATCANAPAHVATVPADDIVRDHLGQPKPSAALLGAFAAFTGEIALDAVLAAIADRFAGKVAAGNQRSAMAAYQWVLDNYPDARGAATGGAPGADTPGQDVSTADARKEEMAHA